MASTRPFPQPACGRGDPRCPARSATPTSAPGAVAVEVVITREPVTAGAALARPDRCGAGAAPARAAAGRRGWRAVWRRAGGDRGGRPPRPARWRRCRPSSRASSADTSTLTTSLSARRSRTGDGMPCAASWLMLTQVAAGSRTSAAPDGRRGGRAPRDRPRRVRRSTRRAAAAASIASRARPRLARRAAGRRGPLPDRQHAPSVRASAGRAFRFSVG